MLQDEKANETSTENSSYGREAARQAVSAYLQQFLEREHRKVAWLARETGMARTTMSRIVHGHILPGPDTCQALARATGVPPEEMLRLAGYLPSHEQTQAEEAGPIGDPELAFYFHQINRLGPENVELFKEFLRQELSRIEATVSDSALSQPMRAPFARPLSKEARGKES